MLKRLLEYLLKHPYQSFFLACFSSLWAAYMGTGVSLRLSLADLLPADRPSIQEVKEISKEIGGVGYFVVLVGPTKEPIQFLPKIKEILRKTPSIKYAFYEREEYGFQDQILYLLPKKELKELTRQIHTLFSDGEENPFSLGIDTEEDKKENLEKAQEYLAKFKEKSNVQRYYEGKNGQYAMILAKPDFDSEDIKRSKKLLQNVEKSLKEKLEGRTNFHLLGRYVNKVRNFEQIQKDITKTAIFALLSISLLLSLGLGSVKAALFTMISVIIAMGWTSGITAIWVGHINILTGFFIAILGGLGVEYGIHLLRRYYQERKQNKNHEEAIKNTYHRMSRVLFSAAITSSAAFFILNFSNFKAFSELGKIAGSGILSIYISYILCFPLTSRFLKDYKKNFRFLPSLFSFYPVNKKWIIAIIPFLLFISYGLWNARFEYNFEKIQSLSKETRDLNQLIHKLFGKSLTPVAIMAKNKEQVMELQEWLEEREQQKTIQETISIHSFTSPDRNRREGIFRKLRKEIKKTPEKVIEEKIGIKKEKIKSWLDAPNYKYNDLPPHIKGLFGKSKNILLIYPRENLNQASALYRFSDTLERSKKKFHGIKIGSDSLIFTEILRHVIVDGKIVMLLFLCGSFFVFWLDFRNIKDALYLFLQLSLGIGVLVGLMGAIHVPFTIINIAMLPAVLAAGVDMGIHVRHQQKEGLSALDATKRVAYSIHLSLVAAILGFAPLFLAQAAALPGVAWISIMGQLSMYILSMLIFPLLNAKYMENKKTRI